MAIHHLDLWNALGFRATVHIGWIPSVFTGTAFEA